MVNMGDMVYRHDSSDLSQARWAQAYVLAISSSAFKLLALLRDCARREAASSISSSGRVLFHSGIRLFRP